MLKRKSTPGKKKQSAKRSRFVLLVGDEGVILLLIEGNAVTRRLFAATPEKENIAALIELLKSFPKTPIYCLVDMIDQSYVRHTLPPVTSIGLKKIIQRRLERDFPRDDIKGSIAIGREKTGRKDWHVLLISLAYNELLKKWLDIVLDQPNRLMGIYLLPVECEQIITKISNALFPEFAKKKKAPKKKKGAPSTPIDEPQEAKWKMLVSHHKVGGVRQVVLKEGKLIFTRLAQSGADGNAELIAGNIEQEMLNTVEYLKRLGFNEKAGLDIFVISSQDIKENLSGQRLPVQHFKILTPFETSELLNLEQAALSGDRYGDVVLAASFGAMAKPRLRLSLPVADKLERLFMGTTAVRAGGALLSLLFIGLTISGIADYFSKTEAVEDYTRKARNKQQELEEFQAQLKTLPADINEINDVVAINALITADTQNPLDLVEQLYPKMDERFLLQAFDWKYNRAVKTAEPSTEPPFTIRFEVELEYAGGEWKDFIEESDKKVNSIISLFPNYQVKRGFLPGQVGDADSLSLSISGEGDDPTAAKSGDTYTLSIELTGPDETATAGQPAPPL